MDYPTTLVYLFDEETLRNLFDDWPSSMRVALCIDEEGTGNVALLRADEVADAPLRIAQLLDRDDADFVIVPTFGGYPTRKIRFSEEQQLCGMVAELSDLPIRARSHLAELSEGPDLTLDECKEPVEDEDRDADAPFAPEEDPDPLHEHVQPVASTDDQAETVLEDAIPAGGVRDDPPITVRNSSRLPAGFVNLIEQDVTLKSPLVGRLSRAGKHVQLTLEGAPLRQRLIEPYCAAEVGASLNLRQLCIVPPKGAPWPPKPGESILFDDRGVGPIASQLSNGHELRVDLVVEGDRLLLSLDDYEVIVGKRRAKRFSKGALGPAFAALVAYAMFQIGTSEEAFRQMSKAPLNVAYANSEAVD